MKVKTFKCPLPELPRPENENGQIGSPKDISNKRERPFSEGRPPNYQGQAAQVFGSKSNH